MPTFELMLDFAKLKIGTNQQTPYWKLIFVRAHNKNKQTKPCMSNDILLQICVLMHKTVHLLLISTPEPQNCNFLGKKETTKNDYTILFGKKKLTYGYQGQKYGFQDKTYGCPYGKKRFPVQKLCCCIFYAYMNGTVFPSSEQDYLQADYNVINSHANLQNAPLVSSLLDFFYSLNPFIT